MLLHRPDAESASPFATEARTISWAAEISNCASSRSKASIHSTRTRLISRMMPCFASADVRSETVAAAALGGLILGSIYAQATIVKAGNATPSRSATDGREGPCPTPIRSLEKASQCIDRLGRTLFQDPVAGIVEDHHRDVGRDELCLCAQRLAQRFLSPDREHRN